MGTMLEGRVAVITGSGGGIGRAHALTMAGQGAKIVVNDIGTSAFGEGTSHEPADAVVEEIRHMGGTAVATYDSVTTEKGAAAIIDAAIDTFGRIDILVNNAGVLREPRDIDEVSFEDWDLVIKTHLYGMFFAAKRASLYMKKQNYGRIINTASHTGLGWRGFADYSAAKEGIIGLTRTVARDLAEFGATCNAIRPVAAWRGTKESLPRVAVNTPADVAVFVAYLASEQAANVNGCIFEVWKGHVGIFIEPPQIREIVEKEDSWTTEELAEILPRTLTKGCKPNDFPPAIPI